ncbi:MAG TPA: cyanophycin synthetase, partial [Thermoanaerobaculia bacterium]|nr:cyanophycin synthetase [Thermoanaerobaculia bacterium]
VHRRFERLGTWRGATVVDDYAHHPREVAATLEAARQAFPGSSIQVIFQPHLFSRTRDLADEFGRALLAADRAFVTEIYPSRESPIPGVSGELVVEAARRSGHHQVRFVPVWDELESVLARGTGEGDVVLTLGAGDIYRFARRLVGESGGEGAS